MIWMWLAFKLAPQRKVWLWI